MSTLPDGVGDSEYLAAVEQGLPRVFAFAPEIIFYQAGVDAMAATGWGACRSRSDGLKQRDRLVLESATRIEYRSRSRWGAVTPN